MSDDLQPTDEPVSADNVTPIGAAKAKRQRKPREERHPNAPPADFARGDQTEIARELLLELEGDGERLVFDYGKLHQYEPDAGTWKPYQQYELSNRVERYAGKLVESDRGKPKPLKLVVGTIDGAIELVCRRRTKPGFFDGRCNGIVFRNGFVTVGPDNIVLVPHAPEHRARASMTFDYDGATPCPRWLQFLEETFRDDADRDAKVRLIQQFFGMCLLGRATMMQVALVFLGGGANGKSVLMDVLSGAFPPSERSASSPQAWGASEYARASLAGIRLNVVSELPIRDILDGAVAKAIISGDTIEARPIRENPVTFRPIAGHIFSTNTLPGVADRSHGFWRRFTIVTFNRTYAREEWNQTLAADLLAAELPGIVCWGLAGAADYLANGLSLPASAAEAMATWRKEANPLALWMDEDTEPVPQEDVAWWRKGTDLLQAFNTWAKKNGHKEVSTTTFGRGLVLLGVEKKHIALGNFYRLDVRRAGTASAG